MRTVYYKKEFVPAIVVAQGVYKATGNQVKMESQPEVSKLGSFSPTKPSLVFTVSTLKP